MWNPIAPANPKLITTTVHRDTNIGLSPLFGVHKINARDFFFRFFPTLITSPLISIQSLIAILWFFFFFFEHFFVFYMRKGFAKAMMNDRGRAGSREFPRGNRIQYTTGFSMFSKKDSRRCTARWKVGACPILFRRIRSVKIYTAKKNEKWSFVVTSITNFSQINNLSLFFVTIFISE